jgi:uncharacterized membrane protein YkoI
MKSFKILPAAATIIALTATIAFASDRKQAEENNDYRVKVETRNAADNADDGFPDTRPIAKDSESGDIYHVVIERGNKKMSISIDAYTGKILGRGEAPVKAS